MIRNFCYSLVPLVSLVVDLCRRFLIQNRLMKKVFMGFKRSHFSIPVLTFIAGLLLVTGLIALQAWWSLRDDYFRTLSQATQNSEFSVRILEEHAGRTFSESVRLIHIVSDTLNDDAGADLHSEQLYRLMQSPAFHTEFVYAVSLLNVYGQVLLKSRTYEVMQSPDIAQRQIRFLQNTPQSAQISVGRPLQVKDSGEWVLPLAKNIFDRSGRLIAIAQIDVRLAYFLRFYGLSSGSELGAISLHDHTGQLLAKASGDAARNELPVTEQKFLQTLSGQAQEGVFIAHDMQGGEQEVLYAYRKMPAIPLTLVFSRATSDILVDWHGRLRHKLVLTASTLLFIFVLGMILLIQLRRLQDSRVRLEASESRYRLLFSGANDAILLINRQYEYVDCNPAAVELFGVPDASCILGKKAGYFSVISQQIAGESLTDSDALVKKYVDLAFTGVMQRLDWVMQRNGRPCYIEITLSKVELDNEPLIFCVERDVSVRRRSELLLEGQNRLLQMIGANHAPLEILNAACDFMTSVNDQWIVCIHLLSEEHRTFSTCIGKKLPSAIQEQFAGLAVSRGSGIWSEAIIHAGPVRTANIHTDECMRFVNGLEKLSACQKAYAWPLMDKHGNVFGAMTLLLQTGDDLQADEFSFVMSMVEIAVIAIEARRSEHKILRLAHYDELTGLPNRFLYNQHLNKALLLAERNHSSLAVLFLDLDRFKNINDTFGHDEGDKVLRNVAHRFTASLRESDVVARIGGDEFILLIDQYRSPADLAEVADKLLFEASQPFDIDGQECQLSASIGIATYPDDGKDAQTLLKNADIAMYRAKNKGKNNYQFYASEMNIHTVEKLAFEARLRRALERREFVVYYQPKVSVATGRIVGAEALVRWNHPERGLLFPNDFIGLAEEAGLISRLGMLVLDIACKDVLSFRQADPAFGRVAINLSASQFNQLQLLEDVKGVAEFWRTPPEALEFEITESMVMHNRDQAIQLMDGFKQAGYSLSIDDFGTGYSSLAYLKRFPVDSVKVDRSFIRDIPEDSNDTAIAHTIIAMAHTLGLKVIAEGVDSVTQLQTLQGFSCDEYQGYFFSKAIPARDFLTLLHQQSK